MSKIIFDVNLGDLETALSDRELSKDETNKARDGQLGGENLRLELEDASKPDVDKNVQINLKSHGIYIQFDRELVKKGIKEWSFMVRPSVWGGGDISWEDWIRYSNLADKYSSHDDGYPSIRLTTRQTFQYHRISKNNLVPIIRSLIDIGKLSLNGCGDNTRNPTASPIKSDLFDANYLAKIIGEYFQLPVKDHFKVFDPLRFHDETSKNKFNYSVMGLPRKLKIGIGGIYTDYETGKIVRCNAADILTNDIAIAPIIKDNNVSGYQVYIGGGLGQKNRKVTFAATALPLGNFKNENDLIRGLDAIVYIQQQVGDRKNRNFARLKNVLIKKGLEELNYNIEDILINNELFAETQKAGIRWFRKQLISIGISFDAPIALNLGKLNRHHGWIKQPDGKLSFGLWIQNGRITNSNSQGKIKALIDKIVAVVKPNIRITPYQDILFTDINMSLKKKLEQILIQFKYQNYSSLRLNSVACVGLNTCPLAVTESEKFFDPLITELEHNGFGNLENISIGISGCERHCSRNVRHPISIEGKSDKTFQLKLSFGHTTSNTLAQDIIMNDLKYLRKIPQEKVAYVLKLLIQNYLDNKKDNESISEFHKRISSSGILEVIRNDKETCNLLEFTSEPFTS